MPHSTTRRSGWVTSCLVLFSVALTHTSAAEPAQMSWLDNGRIRFGADLSIGGAITYLADAEEKVNVIVNK